MQNKRKKKPQILIIWKFRGKSNQIQLLHLSSNSRRLCERRHNAELTEQGRILLPNPNSNTENTKFLQGKQELNSQNTTVLHADHREAFKKGFFGSNQLKKLVPTAGLGGLSPEPPCTPLLPFPR